MSPGKNHPTGPAPRIFYGWYLVIAAWLMIFLMNAVVVSLFFKPMLQDFGVDRATLSLVQTAALLLFAVASPFIGRLIDLWGPRAVIFLCVGTQLASRLINGLAANLGHLFLSRFLYEVRVLHVTQVLANRWFVKKRGLALGILSSGMPVGSLLLPMLTQYMILNWSWRPTMLFWAAITFAVMLPLALLIKDRPEDKGLRPDGEPPTVPTAGTISGTQVKTTVSSRLVTAGSSTGEAFRTKTFWFMSACHLICGIGCGFMQTHIVIFATDMGYSDMIGASLVSVQGGLNLVGVLATGPLSDRVVRHRVLSLVHLIRSLSFFTIVVFILMGGGSLWMLYLGMAFFGFGWFTTSPLQAGLVADQFGMRRMGTLLSIIVAGHTVGSALGAYAGGAIFEATGSYYTFFLIQGLLELVAAALAFYIKRKN